MPVLATQHTAAGAKAFAGFFIKTIDWAYATTSTTYMRHYYVSSCITCRSVADAVDGQRKKGHHFVGDRFAIRNLVSKPSSGTEYRVLATFDVTSVETVTRTNSYVDGIAALNNVNQLVGLMWQSGGWRISHFTLRP